MHIGNNQQSGGRAGEAAAMRLSGSLAEIGLELGRLKDRHTTASAAPVHRFLRDRGPTGGRAGSLFQLLEG